MNEPTHASCSRLSMLGLLTWIACSGMAQPSSATRWVGTWSASAQAIDAQTMPPTPPGLADTTVRQVVHGSVGGKQLRVRFSNAFGPYSTEGLVITAAAVAVSAGHSAIQPETSRRLTFHGHASVAVPRGALTVSDPLDFDLAPGSDLAVTFHVAEPAKEITGHRSARGNVYLQRGDVVAAPDLPGAAIATTGYYLCGVDVLAPADAAAVVCLGDSITDGKGSTEGTNRRWPDFLAKRLRQTAETAQIGVLNQGIGGGALWRGGIGQPAVTRLDRDVLAQPGAHWLIVVEGINDLLGGKTTADELIAGLEQIAVRAHDRGMLVFGGTILPCGGTGHFTPALEEARQQVNRWLRSAGVVDGVVDFDAALRDPEDPTRLRREADSGDHLHPNDTGHRLMAEAVDLSIFVRP